MYDVYKNFATVLESGFESKQFFVTLGEHSEKKLSVRFRFKQAVSKLFELLNFEKVVERKNKKLLKTIFCYNCDNCALSLKKQVFSKNFSLNLKADKRKTISFAFTVILVLIKKTTMIFQDNVLGK